MNNCAATDVELWEEDWGEVMDHGGAFAVFWHAKGPDVAGFKDDVWFKFAEEARDEEKLAVSAVTGDFVAGNYVVIGVGEKIVGALVNESEFVRSFEFEELFN